MEIEDILASGSKCQRRRRGRPGTGQQMPIVGDIIEKFNCPQCPSSFTYERGLQQHLKYACCQRPRFKCPYCDYKTKYRYNAYNHIRNSHKGSDVFCIDMISEKNEFPS